MEATTATAPLGTAGDTEVSVELEERVTPLELFFDLVFVFAITQVSGLLSNDPTWGGLARATLLLGALWWAWAAYAWLTNSFNPDEGGVRLAVFGAMAAMLVVSLAAPHAFGDEGVLFGCAYFVVRALHLVLYAIASRDDPDVHGAVLRMTPSATLGPALLVVAGFCDGVAQGVLWVAALAIDYGGVAVMGSGGWRVAPSHFAERHGLVIMIALGESIVALGLGAGDLEIDLGIVAAAVLGLSVAAALWWAYFDVVAIVAERKLTEAQGAARAAIARDSYSYLHLPMIAGIVLFAVGAKKTLAHVGDPLGTVPALALCGGVSLYLLGHICFRLRNVRSLNRQRLVVAIACSALIPLATHAPALVSLACVATLCTGLIGYEAIHFRDARARVRSASARPA
jgi:low temperature requirement protein LtrA